MSFPAKVRMAGFVFVRQGRRAGREKAKTWRAPLYNIAMVPDAPYIDLGVKLHHTTLSSNPHPLLRYRALGI
jgi:hypothetical protein